MSEIGNLPPSEPPYNPGTCDAILDTAKTIYNEEADRFKQVEAKTSITLTFVGALFAAFLSYLIAFNPSGKDPTYLVYSYCLKAVVLVLLSTSTFFFLRCIRVGEFERVGLDNIVTSDCGREDESWAKLQIAATYKHAIDHNGERIELKMRNYKLGLSFVTWSLIILIIHFVVEEIVKNVK